MSSAKSVSPQSQAGRRSHARRRIDGLAYVEFVPDNGAILVDLGEGGLGFQSVLPVSLNQALLFKFKIPGESNHIDGYAEVAWMNETGKGGGLRFVELNADASAQIREWSGMLLAPETGARRARKGAGSNHTQASAAENAPAHSMQAMQESTAPEPTISVDVPAHMDEAFAESFVPGEGAQVASLSSEANEALPADEAATGEEVLSRQDTLPAALPIPEFIVEIAEAADSNAPLASQIEWAAPAAPPISAASPAESDASKSTLPRDSDQNDDAAEFAADLLESQALRFEESDHIYPAYPGLEIGTAGRSASNDLTHRASDSPKTTAGPKTTVAASPTPAKAARRQDSDAGNFASVQKPQRRPVPSKPEAPAPAYRQDSDLRGFVRQPQKPASARTEWNYPPTSQEDELKPQATLGSQALKVGIGAAAGACLVLALVLSISSLRARVQATASAKSTNLANSPGFQLEVADLNNRRWILKSGGDAGSPFGDPPSRRETQLAASAAARGESAKASRSDDSGDSSDSGNPANTPKSKLPKPSELALSRPHTAPPAGTSAQIVAPSIFDGITPPIGSVGDRLAAGGPELPGIVPSDNQSGLRTSTLQSAVLEQRVAPVYPANALQSRREGEVLVNATIDRDGVPKNLKLIRGDELLAPAALTAIRQWHYRPATLGGQPIETQIVITINFALK